MLAPRPAASSGPPATVPVPQACRRQVRFQTGEKRPCRRVLFGKACSLMFRDTVARKSLSGGRRESTKALRRTVDHSDGHLGCDTPPIMPAVKLRKIVRSHDPDKVQAGSAAAQISNRVRSVTRSDDGFETTDLDARIVRDKLCRFHALGKIMRRPVGLERIAWRHQPPHPVELQTLDREQADGAVSQMRRIERSAQQADTHAVDMGRKGGSNGGQGRRNLVQRLPRCGQRMRITAASARCRERGI
jgi:hypothetical protein